MMFSLYFPNTHGNRCTDIKMEMIYSRTTSRQVEQAWLDTHVPVGDLPLQAVPSPLALRSLSGAPRAFSHSGAAARTSCAAGTLRAPALTTNMRNSCPCSSRRHLPTQSLQCACPPSREPVCQPSQLGAVLPGAPCDPSLTHPAPLLWHLMNSLGGPSAPH